MNARSIAAALLFAASGSGTADAALYNATLDVTSVLFQEPCSANGLYIFGCIDVGDKYFGTFDIPDSELLTDGVKDNAGITNFRIDLGLWQWNQNGSGFRDSQFQFSKEPGVLIAGGEVTSLLGGALSASDAPYIDFPTNAPGNFVAQDFAGERVTGTIGMRRRVVPEPETLLLFGIGAVAFVAERRRKINHGA